MRIYLHSSGQQVTATAPEMPGVFALGDSPEAASAACRALIETELAVYADLGEPLAVTGGIHEIHDWAESGPAVYPEDLQPATREFVRAVMRRIEHMRAEMDDFLDSLTPQEWEQHPQGEWNVRTVLDHIANSQWLIVDGLHTWALEPLRAQEEALKELYEALLTLSPRRRSRTTWHFGLNRENGRISWTPGKLVRVVGTLQDNWLAHLEQGEPVPPFPQGHANQPGDTEPPNDREIEALWYLGQRLLQVAFERQTDTGMLALYYRYYRNRLVSWPEEPRQRWESVWQLTRSRLLSLSDAELALVRVSPAPTGYGGRYGSVRQALSLSLAHMRQHFEQMRRAVGRDR